MPDPIVLVQAVASAAGFAAAAAVLFGIPWGACRPSLARAGGALGVGVGFLLGCWLLGARPRWLPREDQDRLLLLLLPAAVVVEMLAAWPRLAWALRLALAAVAGRVLLHNTSYLTDLAGPGSREWTLGQAALVLTALAGALAVVWAALAMLARRRPGGGPLVALAIPCAGAAATVMLSGYSSGGQLGLPLAGALAGVAVATLVVGRFDSSGALGPGLVGLFGLLVIGRYFGVLTTTHAALLLFAPLLCWLPELPYLCAVRPWLRTVTQAVVVSVPVVLAVTQAQEKFVAASATPTAVREPSVEDYMSFGK